MERNAFFYRLIFFFISCLAMTTYEFSTSSADHLTAFFMGFSKGSLIFLLLIGCETGLKRVSLRSFNTTLVGIAVGTLMGYVIGSCLHALFSLMGLKPTGDLNSFLILFTYLSSLYIGINATYSAAEEWWLSIPFVQLTPATSAKKKELLLDITAIEDTRLNDLARSGILDHQLVLPTFVLKEIQKGMEAVDEATKTRFRKCYEQIKRFENMAALGLLQKEFHTSELDDLNTKLLRTAKLVQAHILTSEQNNFKQGEEDGIIIISLEGIANSIKPSAQRGEVLTIKIQRPGKEPKQGVGYLEDGTMVVVNGGGDFLGETIKTQVLSQKYSSSGKIIFCNALQQNGTPHEDANFGSSPYTMPSTTAEKREEVYVAPTPRVRKEPHQDKYIQDRQSYDPWNRH